MYLKNEVHVQAAKRWMPYWLLVEDGCILAKICCPREECTAKKYLASQADMEEEHALFHVCNSLVLSKRLLYISTMPKGE